MTGRPPQAGPAPLRAGARILAGVAIALAMAAPVSRSGAVAGGEAPARAGPAPRAGRVAFSGLPWGAAPGTVAKRLAGLGFRRVAATGGEAGGEVWRGRWLGEPATCTPESRGAEGLVSLTLRFEPGSPGDAGWLYRRLLADMGRRLGPGTADVEPSRASGWRREGPGLRRVWIDDPAGARFWVGEDGAAAVLQLDGRSVVWLRWEAPGWTPDGEGSGPGG